MSDPLYTPRFRVGSEVTHKLASGSRGIVTAFMVRGTNRTYEVSWGIDRSVWHLEAELDEWHAEAIGFPVDPDSTGGRPSGIDLPVVTC